MPGTQFGYDGLSTSHHRLAIVHPGLFSQKRLSCVENDEAQIEMIGGHDGRVGSTRLDGMRVSLEISAIFVLRYVKTCRIFFLQAGTRRTYKVDIVEIYESPQRSFSAAVTDLDWTKRLRKRILEYMSLC